MPSQLIAGRYEIEAPISEGPDPTVYRARDRVLARIVAIKVLTQAGGEHVPMASAALAHPGIAQIYDSGVVTHGGVRRPYVVVEYCEGGNLDDALAKLGTLDPTEVVRIGRALCEALAYAHSRGVHHGRLKASDVLFGPAGAVKLSDLGLPAGAPATGGPAEDVRAVGMLMFEMLTGHPASAPGAGPSTLRGGIPRELDAIVARALADDSEHWPSPIEMGRALEHLNLPRLARPPGHVDAGTERAPDTRWIAPVVGLVAVGILLALVVPTFVTRDQPRTPPPSSGADQSAPLSAVAIEAVADFDPHGDGAEHPELATLATDGDVATAWTTERYSSPLGTLGKPGVGLLLDLGRSSQVSRVEVRGEPGYALEVRAGEFPRSNESSLAVVATLSGAPATAKLDFEPVTARYWLIWITRLSDAGGGRASISEVGFFGK